MTPSLPLQIHPLTWRGQPSEKSAWRLFMRQRQMQWPKLIRWILPRMGRRSLEFYYMSTVVRGDSVWSNHPELTRTCPIGLLPPAAKWFEEVRCGRNTPNSLKTALWACFPLYHSGSRRFSVVEPPQTHSNLPCRHASPCITVVRGGSAWSNHPDPHSNLPSRPASPASQWFEEVWCGGTTLNCRPSSPFITVVRGGSMWSNHKELTRNCPVGLLPPAAKWFEEVWCWRTTPNSLKLAL